MAFLGIGGSSSVPGIDAAALRRINQENLKRQKNIIQGLNPSLQPINQSFETKTNALGEQILPGAENQLQAYGKNLAGIGALEKEQGQKLATNFREQQFRQVPDLQRAIRESLGAGGLSGNATAASAVANPVINAANVSRDLEAGLATQQLQNEIGRKQGFAETGFNTRGAALEKKFGLDKDTINYLTSIGREDLIREAGSLLGSEEQFGANELAIEQARQASEIAKAQAKNAQRGNLISSLSGLAGTGIGAAFGGPLGAAIGGQIGGTVGNIAGGVGGAQQIDPSLLFLLNQRKSGPSAQTLNFVRN